MHWGHKDEHSGQVMPSWGSHSALPMLLFLVLLTRVCSCSTHPHTHHGGGEEHGFWPLGDPGLESGSVSYNLGDFVASDLPESQFAFLETGKVNRTYDIRLLEGWKKVCEEFDPMLEFSKSN